MPHLEWVRKPWGSVSETYRNAVPGHVLGPNFSLCTTNFDYVFSLISAIRVSYVLGKH